MNNLFLVVKKSGARAFGAVVSGVIVVSAVIVSPTATQAVAEVRPKALSTAPGCPTPEAVLTPPRTTSGKTAKRPVLFVHGRGSCINPDFILGPTSVYSRFVGSGSTPGYGWKSEEMYGFDYDTDLSNVITAQQLKNRVDAVLARTGWDTLDIIAFSQGSLPSRYYIQRLGGNMKVRHWASIAGPNTGSDGAVFICALAFYQAQGCNEIIPTDLFQTELRTINYLPGPTRYETWRSNCDGMIWPSTRTELTGAYNHIVNYGGACPTHAQMPQNEQVANEIRFWFEQYP
ncbi:MAG: esterase/lipase family protein [Mycobacteriaceae bacterium]